MADLSEKSLEELEDLLRNPSKIEGLDVEPDTPSDKPEPVAEPAQVEPPAPVNQEPEPSPPPTEPAEPSVEELDRKILEARVEELQAQVKHFESLAGRNGGEVGWLRNQLKSLEARMAQPATASDDLEPPPPAPHPQRPLHDPALTWAVQQAASQSGAQFISRHQDLQELGGQEAIGKILQEAGYDASVILESGDPSHAAQETTRALEMAYWQLKNRHVSSVRSDLEKRRADQLSRLKDAKRMSAPSASGAAPTPKPVVQPMSEWSLKDLEKELKRLTGE